MEIYDIANKIIKRYPHIELEDIEDMVECAKDILLSTLYPFDENINEIPRRKITWIYRCVIEQIEKQGATSSIAYKENGIQINFDKTQVSQGLLNEILPFVGI